MRFDYSKWKGPKAGDVEFLRQLMEIYRNLLLQTGGDVDEALRWMEHFGREYGFFDGNFSLEDFKAARGLGRGQAHTARLRDDAAGRAAHPPGLAERDLLHAPRR